MDAVLSAVDGPCGPSLTAMHAAAATPLVRPGGQAEQVSAETAGAKYPGEQGPHASLISTTAAYPG